MHIDFALSSEQTKTRELAKMDMASLRYYALPGDIILRADGRDLSARWGWVPVLDFDLSLQQILNELKDSSGAMSLFEFTESDATLSFARDGDDVVIAASYCREMVRVTLIEFSEAVRAFHNKLLEDIRSKFPQLLDNKNLLEAFPDWKKEREFG